MTSDGQSRTAVAIGIAEKHAERARLVARGGDDAAPVGASADRDRLPAQRRIVALLDRRVEGVHVDVHDSTHHRSMYNYTFPMPQFIYTMKGLGKVHPPDAKVLEDIWLSFYFGAKIGVLGLNGAGKSSLLKIMSGEDQSFIGEAFPGEGISIGFLHQEPRLDPAKDVRGNVEEGVADVKALLAALRRRQREARRGSVAGRDGEGARRAVARSRTRSTPPNAWDLDSRLELAMDALRLPPPDADVTTLSGGERRRVALCRLLLQSPDLLLLDEPTNHLDAESVAWLERFLKDYAGTVVAVTHDRYFLDNVAGWILELDRGRGIPWEGNYSSWLEQKQNRLQQEEKAEIAQAADARARARSGSACRRAPPGQGQGAPQRLRRPAARRVGVRRSRPPKSTSRRARGSATSSSRPAACGRATATTC